MNIPQGIDKIKLKDGSARYRVRIRIKGHRPLSKNFKRLQSAKKWKRIKDGLIEEGLNLSHTEAENILLLIQSTDISNKYSLISQKIARTPKDIFSDGDLAPFFSPVLARGSG